MTVLAPTRRQVLAGFAGALLAPVPWHVRARAAEEPLHFPNPFGITRLAQPAVRVVSLGYSTQDTLLALGVVPVAVREWFGDQPHAIWPWAQPYLKDAKPAVIKGNVALEVVAALRPDLIVGIGSGISQGEYDALSRVAPVLLQPPEYQPFGMPWDKLTRIVGRAVGKEIEADELVKQRAGEFAATRERHPEWAGRTAVAAYHYGGETGLFAANDTRGRVLKELGFVLPPEVARLDAQGNFYHKLSAEDLSLLDADLLLWISSSDEAPDLVGLPMRRALKAHKQGREVFAGGITAAAMSFGSILSLPFVVSNLEADIAAAMDGDPSTAVSSAARAGLTP